MGKVMLDLFAGAFHGRDIHVLAAVFAKGARADDDHCCESE